MNEVVAISKLITCTKETVVTSSTAGEGGRLLITKRLTRDKRAAGRGKHIYVTIFFRAVCVAD